jgi:hypothetical protein
MPQEQFSSRWADLNHPCNNGDLITFLSGGTIDIGGHTRKSRVAKAERRAAREGWVLNEEKHHAAWQLESNGGCRLMGQDVFYMMICNMPSEEKMVAAREHIKAWWLPGPSKATEGTSQELSPMPSKQ